MDVDSQTKEPVPSTDSRGAVRPPSIPTALRKEGETRDLVISDCTMLVSELEAMLRRSIVEERSHLVEELTRVFRLEVMKHFRSRGRRIAKCPSPQASPAATRKTKTDEAPTTPDRQISPPASFTSFSERNSSSMRDLDALVFDELPIQTSKLLQRRSSPLPRLCTRSPQKSRIKHLPREGMCDSDVVKSDLGGVESSDAADVAYSESQDLSARRTQPNIEFPTLLTSEMARCLTDPTKVAGKSRFFKQDSSDASAILKRLPASRLAADWKPPSSEAKRNCKTDKQETRISFTHRISEYFDRGKASHCMDVKKLKENLSEQVFQKEDLVDRKFGSFRTSERNNDDRSAHGSTPCKVNLRTHDALSNDRTSANSNGHSIERISWNAPNEKRTAANSHALASERMTWSSSREKVECDLSHPLQCHHGASSPKQSSPKRSVPNATANQQFGHTKAARNNSPKDVAGKKRRHPYECHFSIIDGESAIAPSFARSNSPTTSAEKNRWHPTDASNDLGDALDILDFEMETHYTHPFRLEVAVATKQSKPDGNNPDVKARDQPEIEGIAIPKDSGMVISDSEESMCGSPCISSSFVSKGSQFRAKACVKKLRQLRERELMISGVPEMDSRRFAPYESVLSFSDIEKDAAPFLLCLSGILPWSRVAPTSNTRVVDWWPLWYQKSVLVLVLGASLSTVTSMFLHGDYFDVALYSDIPLIGGSLVGTLSLRTFFSEQPLHACCNLLRSYAYRNGFLEQWTQSLRWDVAIIAVVWLLVVLERFRGMMSDHGAVHSIESWLHQITFMFASAILMSLAFCINYVCRALTLMVDMFCCQVVNEGNLMEAVRNWNILQAVLRKASSVIESCFFSLQATAFCALLLSMVDGLQGKAWSGQNASVTTMPSLLVILILVWTFFRAASVTDKCAHVPSLINSLSFSDVMDTQRQYAVEYIINSNAGFYVFEVHLTSAVAFKSFYLLSVVVFGITTKIMTTD